MVAVGVVGVRLGVWGVCTWGRSTDLLHRRATWVFPDCVASRGRCRDAFGMVVKRNLFHGEKKPSSLLRVRF